MRCTAPQEVHDSDFRKKVVAQIEGNRGADHLMAFKCAKRAPPRKQATTPKIAPRAVFDSIFLGKRWKNNKLISKYARVRKIVPASIFIVRLMSLVSLRSLRIIPKFPKFPKFSKLPNLSFLLSPFSFLLSPFLLFLSALLALHSLQLPSYENIFFCNNYKK